MNYDEKRIRKQRETKCVNDDCQMVKILKNKILKLKRHSLERMKQKRIYKKNKT